jgi:transcriptional regulator GlxA family with amidase domain
MSTLALSQSQQITNSRRIGFLVYPGCEILDVCGPYHAFFYADTWLTRFGRTNEAGYQCIVIAAAPGRVRTKCGIEITPTHTFREVGDKLDTLVVAGGCMNVEEACEDPTLVEWVHSIAPRTRRVASICTGAFILAAAGLLNHRRVTTHWMFVGASRDDLSVGSCRFRSSFRSRWKYLLFRGDHRRNRSGPCPT